MSSHQDTEMASREVGPGRSGNDSQAPVRAGKRQTSPLSSLPKRRKEPPMSLDKEGSMPTKVPHVSQQTGYRYHVVNKVVCTRNSPHCHLRIYEDEPRPRESWSTCHLAGDCPIVNAEEFLKSRPKTAFIVFRIFICIEVFQDYLLATVNDRGPAFPRGFVAVVSTELQDTIQRVSKFAPHVGPYDVDCDRFLARGADWRNNFAPSEYSWRFFFHHREELEEEAAKAEDGSALKTLVSFLSEDAHTMYARYDDMFSRRMVSAESLPWLFRPNEIVVTWEGDLAEAYVVREFPPSRSPLRIPAWIWAYDGHFLRRRDCVLNLELRGCEEVRIDSLIVYPLRYATEETKNTLLEHGKKFFDLIKQPQLVSYEGLDYPKHNTYPTESRFMLDYKTYLEENAVEEGYQFSKLSPARFDRWPKFISVGADVSDLDKMMLPRTIDGFFLKDKTWEKLLVKQIRPVKWNKASFKRLVLPRRFRNLIKGQVMDLMEHAVNASMQIQRNTRQDDMIAGKGNGLTVLLNGGPGTGKTLTAECVAEMAEMPLYSVPYRDIGTTSEEVATFLNPLLRLMRRWNGVLLLEDAFPDGFDDENLLRDRSVSKFLKDMEYNENIVFLTSRRASNFREGVLERVQLPLRYPRLSTQGQREIWRGLVATIEEEDGMPIATVDETRHSTHLSDLAKYDLNGRQIRNAVAMARRLAVFDGERLSWDRIKNAADVVSDFDKPIEGVNGCTNGAVNGHNGHTSRG